MMILEHVQKQIAGKSCKTASYYNFYNKVIKR